jgi:hypothetical protein
VICSSSVSQAAAKNWKVPAAGHQGARFADGLAVVQALRCASASARADQLGHAVQHGGALVRLASAPSRWCGRRGRRLDGFSTSARLAAFSSATTSPVAG